MSWLVETVEAISGLGQFFMRLRYDSTGRPHLLYWLAAAGFEGLPSRHAVKDGGVWAVETVPTLSGPRD